jgi:hypothetical protein
LFAEAVKPGRVARQDLVSGSEEDENDMDGIEKPSFSFPEGVLARAVDGEMVVLNLKTEQYYGLDAVGADILTRLTQGPKDQVVSALCRDYEVDPRRLQSDVDRLVGELLAAGLLERTTPE